MAAASTADRLHSVLYAQRLNSELASLFSSPETNGIDTVEVMRDLYASDVEFEDDVEAMSYMDVMCYIGNHHVHRIDQFTMAVSVEGRFPFLDHHLVEAAFRMPSRHKINGRAQKYVLRQVAKRYIAPACLAMKKKGFTLPLRQWLVGPLKELVDTRLRRLKERPFISPEAVDWWQGAYRRGQASPQKIWHLVALELWYERFIEGGSLQ